MPKTKTTKTTKAARAPGGELPANWQWREGRPRWIPSPSLRKAGWRGRDLKDAKTQGWLSYGLSIDAAATVNQAVAAWRRGELVPASFADIAPPEACEKPRLTSAEKLARHSIGQLADEWTGVKDGKKGWKVEPSNEFAELSAGTQTEYRSKIKRLIDALAGYYVLPAKDAKPAELAEYTAAVDAIRKLSIKILETPEEDEDGEAELYTAFWGLRRQAGPHAADGVLRVASTWLEWCRKRKRAIRSNPTQDVDRVQLEGRLKPASWEALAAIIETAEEDGWFSIADSVILGVDLSWSEADRLALIWPQISPENRVRARRQKTGRPGETPLLDQLGIPRIAKIRERQAAIYGDNVQTTHVLICETTKRPWKANHYQVVLAEIRAKAATKVPSAAEVLDKDLRSTAVCFYYNAGMSKVQIAGRTLHSLKQIDEILDRHYGAIGREIADQGADLANAYLKAKGIAL